MYFHNLKETVICHRPHRLYNYPKNLSLKLHFFEDNDEKNNSFLSSFNNKHFLLACRSTTVATVSERHSRRGASERDA